MKLADKLLNAEIMKTLKGLEDLSKELSFDKSSPIAEAASQVKNKEVFLEISRKTAYLRILRGV